MSSRSKTKTSYKQHKAQRITNADKIINQTKWLTFTSDEFTNTIYVDHPTLNDIRFDDIPQKITGFEIDINGNKKHKFVVMNIKNENDTISNQCVNINDLCEEEYFPAIVGHEEQLESIGIFAEKFFRENKIKKALLIYKYKIGDKVSINSREAQRIIHGSIKKKKIPKYIKHLVTPYYFEANNINEKKYNKWIFQAEINVSGQYEDIFVTEIVQELMLSSIECGTNQYISSKMLKNVPVFLNINSPYFGKKNEFLAMYSVYNNPHQYTPKLITYQYLQTAIEKGVKLKLNLRSNGNAVIRNVLNENNCLTLGTFCDCDTVCKLLKHLASDNVENIIHGVRAIQWQITLLFYQNILKLSNVIHVNKDLSNVTLCEGKDLYVIWDRKTKHIVLQKFYYECANREVVGLRNRNKKKI